MAQFGKRIKTTTRHEYVVPSPCNWAEVDKAISYAHQEYMGNTGKSITDDSVWVTHSDEEIIIYWEQEA